MRLRHLVPVAAVPLVIAVTPPAYAAVTATFIPGDGSYSVNGDTGDNDIDILCNTGATNPVSTPNAPCVDVKTMDVNPGDGTDTVDLSLVSAATFPNLTGAFINADTEIFSPAADTLIGSQLPDSIYADFLDQVKGGGGNDYFEGGDKVEGEAGNDIFYRIGADHGVFGGPGDDRFIDGLPVGGIVGGTGDDSLELDLNAASPGLSANVLLVFNSTNMHIEVPPSTIGDVPVTGVEHLVLTLLDSGTQTVNAKAFPGDLVIRGFGGTDVITGTLRTDVLRGGTGNDTIDSQDGGFDLVDCGLGTDTAKVDASDQVVGCETVKYAAPQTSTIKGPRNIAKGKSGLFKFSSNVPGSVFQCKIDNKPWKSCKSPYAVGTGTLSLGLHTLKVRAGYPKGNWDKTPAKKNFGVTN